MLKMLTCTGMLPFINIVNPPAAASLNDGWLFSPYINHDDINCKFVSCKWCWNDILAFPLSNVFGCILVYKNAEFCKKLLPLILKMNSPYPFELLTIIWFMCTSCTERKAKAALCCFLPKWNNLPQDSKCRLDILTPTDWEKCRPLFGAHLILVVDSGRLLVFDGIFPSADIIKLLECFIIRIPSKKWSPFWNSSVVSFFIQWLMFSRYQSRIWHSVYAVLLGHREPCVVT